MAVCLFISSNPPLTLHCSSSSFKGDLKHLRAQPSPILRVNLNSNGRKPRKAAQPLAVLSRESSSSVEAAPSSNVRFRLDNLGPQPGSRKKAKRKGRGISAGQGASCGFGMRGQKSRKGPGVRKGFEGGQMPLYRRTPKLRGIAGGMHTGSPKYVPVNLKDIEAAGFKDGDEVSLESLKQKGLINPSGRERKLPLKILGDGEISAKLSLKARAFSASAKAKLEAAGCSVTVLAGRKKWLKPSVQKNLARAEEYFAKKKAESKPSDST